MMDGSIDRIGKISENSLLKLTREEVNDFALLTQSGLSIRDSILLAFHQPEPVLQRLASGESLSSVLTEHQKGRFFVRLRDLLKISDLPCALRQVIALEQGSSRLMETLAKNAVYPMFLMFFSWLLLWFFALQILPAMSVYSRNSDFIILYLLLAFFTIFWVFLFLSAGFWLAGRLLFPSGSAGLYQIRSRISRRSALLQKVCSYQLACLLGTLFSSGLSTAQAINSLTEMKSAGIFSSGAEIWLTKMNRGVSFEACLCQEKMLDPVFLRFLVTGFETGKIRTLLESYRKQVLIQIEKQMKKISLTIQCLSYGCVGMLCISVYQVMLAPLNMLNTM